MKLLLTTIFITLLTTFNLIAIENKIILKIENEIITSIDIENEKNYLRALNPNIEKLNEKEIYDISINSLIREKIKKKEILKYVEKIELKENNLNLLIKQRFSRLELSNKSQFINYLKKYKINIKTIEKKIAIEAMWNQLIYQKFSKNVKIDKDKLEKQLDIRIRENQKILLLSEIVFKINDKNELNKKYSKILENITKDGFENAALIHSISDSSNIGGKLGWIKQSSLNSDISSKLSNLSKGDISKPIFTPNGYIILKINDVKIETSEIDKGAELEEIIALKTNQQLNQQSIIFYNKIKKDTNINEL